MRFDTDLLASLPDWYKAILDYQELCLAEGKQFEALAQGINAVADNFFFQTMDLGTVAQWEGIFGIIPDPAVESLEFRRSRLINRVSSKPPYTLGFLYPYLADLAISITLIKGGGICVLYITSPPKDRKDKDEGRNG